jgi:hypothetical protein
MHVLSSPGQIDAEGSRRGRLVGAARRDGFLVFSWVVADVEAGFVAPLFVCTGQWRVIVQPLSGLKGRPVVPEGDAAVPGWHVSGLTKSKMRLVSRL